MNRSKVVRITTLLVVGLGASALTVVILFVPELGATTLLTLVAARVVLGLARWGLAFKSVRRLLADGLRQWKSALGHTEIATPVAAV